MRSEILKLRNDPTANAVDGRRLHPGQRRRLLSERLGRAPSEGELYIAHFLGRRRRGASDLAGRRHARRPARQAIFRMPRRPILRSSTIAPARRAASRRSAMCSPRAMMLRRGAAVSVSTARQRCAHSHRRCRHRACGGAPPPAVPPTAADRRAPRCGSRLSRGAGYRGHDQRLRSPPCRNTWRTTRKCSTACSRTPDAPARSPRCVSQLWGVQNPTAPAGGGTLDLFKDRPEPPVSRRMMPEST